MVERIVGGTPSFLFEALTVVGAALAVAELNSLSRQKISLTQRELDKDSIRYQFLLSIDPVRAQSFFWKVQTKKERNKAIDEAIQASAQTVVGK